MEFSFALDNKDGKGSIMVFDMTGNIAREFNLKRPKGELTNTADQIGKGMSIYALVQNGEELASKKMIIK